MGRRSGTKVVQDIKDMKFDWNQKERNMEEKGSLINNIGNKQIECIKRQDLEYSRNPH